ADVLAGAGGQRAARADLCRDVGAEAGGEAREQRVVVDLGGAGGQSQRGRRVARPAPQAGGHRDVLGDRQADGRAVPAGRRAEGGERLSGEVGTADARADDLVAGRAGGRGLEHEVVRERHRLHDRDELVTAVGPRRRSATRTESTFGTGVKTVRATGRRTRTSHAICARTLGRPYAEPPARAARRSPTSFWTIATHRCAPGSSSMLLRIALAAMP